MSLWISLAPMLATAPLWVYNITQIRKMIKRKREQKAERERVIREREMRRTATVREVPEVQTYCAGCDEVVPESWMAWLDADDDGDICELYRCCVCRGVDPPVKPGYQPVTWAEAAQEIPEVETRWDRSVFQGKHESGCQCSNCHPEQLEPWGVGPGSVVEFADNRGDDTMEGYNGIRFQEMTTEQIANLQETAEVAGVDLGGLLANYTEAVEAYRAAGVDATNETDALYRERMRERDIERRRREALRDKYRMNEPPRPAELNWKRQAIANGDW